MSIGRRWAPEGGMRVNEQHFLLHEPPKSLVLHMNSWRKVGGHAGLTAAVLHCAMKPRADRAVSWQASAAILPFAAFVE
jgi:hypothetical protein